MKPAMSLAFVVVMATLACSVCVGCKNGGTAAAQGKKGLRQVSFPVEVLKVEAPPHDVVIELPGVVDAFEHIQVTARVSGVLDKVAFTEGQDVKKGQVLAYIDSRRYALAVSQAKAAVAKAEATAADTEASVKRREAASQTNPGLIPGEELESYQTKLRTANADVDQAREALKLAQLNLSDSSVRALAEGVIQTRSVETGQYVQTGTVLATLLQRDPMLLHFNVATTKAPRVKVGSTVEFTLKESQQTYTAKVTLVSASADPDTRLVPVVSEVQSDHKFWLRPGSFAQVRITLTPTRLFPMIPQYASRPSDRGFLAYVVDGDTVHERVLQFGLHTAEGWVEVRDGLTAGETIVTRGLEALAEGTKIRIVQPSPSGSGSAVAASSGAPPASGSAPRGQRRHPPGAASAVTAGAP